MTHNVILRTIASATKLVDNWPPWKQNILENSSKPSFSTPRKPVNNMNKLQDLVFPWSDGRYDPEKAKYPTTDTKDLQDLVGQQIVGIKTMFDRAYYIKEIVIELVNGNKLEVSGSYYEMSIKLNEIEIGA